jgi:hypothetical protein
MGGIACQADAADGGGVGDDEIMMMTALSPPALPGSTTGAGVAYEETLVEVTKEMEAVREEMGHKASILTRLANEIEVLRARVHGRLPTDYLRPAPTTPVRGYRRDEWTWFCRVICICPYSDMDGARRLLQKPLGRMSCGFSGVCPRSR